MENDEVDKIIHKLWDWREPGRPNEEAIALIRRLRDERDEARIAFDVRETVIATIRNEYHAAAIQRDEARNKAMAEIEGLKARWLPEIRNVTLDEAAVACTKLLPNAGDDEYGSGWYRGVEYAIESILALKKP